MAKIGTAHVEVKAVINEESLRQIEERVAEAVRRGVRAGMAVTPSSAGPFTATWNGPICGKCGTNYLGSHTCAAG